MTTSWHELPLFVYGTLKRGEPNSYWLSKPENGKQEYIGDAETVEAWPLVIGQPFNTPFLLDQQNWFDAQTVRGELYRVDENMLQKLDILEGHPDIYRRTIIEVRLTGKTADILPEHPEIGQIQPKIPNTEERDNGWPNGKGKVSTNVNGSDSRFINNIEISSLRSSISELNDENYKINSVKTNMTDQHVAYVREDIVNNNSATVHKSTDIIVKCETYLMKNYNKTLLELPKLSEYSRLIASSMNQPYGGIPSGKEFFDSFSIVKDDPSSVQYE